MSEYFVGSTGANNQTNFSSLDTSEVLDDLGLNTGDSPTFSGLFLEGSGSTIFSVDGSNGRLFGVTDEVTGTVFSVNDAAGLPIIEVESTSSYDKITLGEYGSDLLVLSGQNTIEITGSQIASQSWVGQQGFTTSGGTDDQNLNEVLAEGNTSSYGISVNQITGTALTIDTDTLFVDSTNDRVGIGTTSPKSILELASQNPVINFKDTNAGADLSYRYIQNVDGKFLFAKANDAYNSFTTHMAIDTDGNVGIGITSPNELLHVEDSSSSSGTSIAIQNAFGESPKNIKFRYNDTVETARIEGFGRNNTSQLPYLAFHVNQTTSSSASNDVAERMRIDSSGNVGIGTTSPNRDLQIGDGSSNSVVAIVGSTAGLAQLALGDTDDDNYGQIILDNSTNKLQIQNGGGGPVGDRGITLDSSQKVGIGTASPTDILTINETADSNGIRINGYDDESSSYLKMFVDNNGRSRIAQNTDGSSGYLFLEAEDYLQLIAGSFVYTTGEFRIYDAGQLSLGNGADFKIKYDNSTDKLNIYSSTNNGITMDTSGNVGIGTTSPSY